MCGGSEAVERKSERMDTAYSPRLHEWLRCGWKIANAGWLCRNRSWIRHEGWLSRGWGMVEESARELGTANAPFHIKKMSCPVTVPNPPNFW